MIKVLHTSDWHIGRRLKNHDRLEEFKKFFDWLEKLIIDENIDILLVSGDIFDSTTPSAQAQDIYYSFISKVVKSNCRHTIIISGNHDSPALINAPSELLKLLKIHVVGNACENPSDEVIKLYDENGNLEMIICAVPYLRDRDVRILKGGQELHDIEKDLINGIEKHYEKVFEYAKEIQNQQNISITAMGHLFIKGGKTEPDDGVRSLYVGTAVEISNNIFPDFLTYVALGHLHTSQKSGRDNIRYSGSPLAMDFGEAGRNKSVNIIEIDGKNLVNIKEVTVPIFQRLERIKGDIEKIFADLQNLTSENESIWLDIVYNGNETIGDLQDKLEEFTKNFPHLEILSIKDESKNFYADTTTSELNIESVTPLEMLDLFFKENDTSEDQREIFINMYKEILDEVQNENT